MDSRDRKFWLVEILIAIGVGFTAGATYTRTIGILAFIAVGVIGLVVFVRLPKTKSAARKVTQAIKDGIGSEETKLNLPDPPKIRRNLVVGFWDLDKDVFIPCDAHRMFWNSSAFSFTASVKPIKLDQENLLEFLLLHSANKFVVAGREPSHIGVALCDRSSAQKHGEWWDCELMYYRYDNSDGVQKISRELEIFNNSRRLL